MLALGINPELQNSYEPNSKRYCWSGQREVQDLENNLAGDQALRLRPVVRDREVDHYRSWWIMVPS